MTRIKELRQAANLTQAKFAEYMGVTQSTVSQWEAGTVFPAAAKLARMAEVLGCTVGELFAKAEA